jgi:separase
VEHLEKHVTEFFHELPDVPIVCISMLGGDFVNVLGETLLLPSLFPAWMLISRFDSTNKPTTILLPVDPISKGAVDFLLIAHSAKVDIGSLNFFVHMYIV